MRFQVGDMVSISNHPGSLGMIVKVGKANSGSLMSSLHSASLVQNALDLYYVLLTTSEVEGPYYVSELTSWN